MFFIELFDALVILFIVSYDLHYHSFEFINVFLMDQSNL